LGFKQPYCESITGDVILFISKKVIVKKDGMNRINAISLTNIREFLKNATDCNYFYF